MALHYAVMSTVFANPQMWKNSPNPPPFDPQKFVAMFVWFYVLFGAMLVLSAVLNLFSGLFLMRRRQRTFSIVVAALDCLAVPFGTVLGVFTILVLSPTACEKRTSSKARIRSQSRGSSAAHGAG